MNSKFAVLCLAAALTGASVLAVGFIGTPTAELGKGQWGLGVNYSYSSQNLEKKVFIVPNWTLAGWADKLKLNDFDTTLYYATLSYGAADGWELYGQLGIADVKARAIDTYTGITNDTDKWGTNYDNRLAWGWGTKVTFLKQDKIDWGAAFQMNWLDTHGSGIVTGREYKSDIETYDMLFAAGPTIDMGGWKIYGGPYYDYLNGKYDFKGVPAVGGVGVDNGHADLRNNDFGGYIGTQFNLASNCSANIEYSNNFDNGWGIGTGLTFKF